MTGSEKRSLPEEAPAESHAQKHVKQCVRKQRGCEVHQKFLCKLLFHGIFSFLQLLFLPKFSKGTTRHVGSGLTPLYHSSQKL